MTILDAATHEAGRGDYDFFLIRSHYNILTPTQPEGSGRPKSNSGPPHQMSGALPIELLRSPRHAATACTAWVKEFPGFSRFTSQVGLPPMRLRVTQVESTFDTKISTLSPLLTLATVKKFLALGDPLKCTLCKSFVFLLVCLVS